ncbi:DNA polymerase III subunit delta [Lactococcus fujiensis]|uniref:DNA polymerase III subunit delta n=1 Tax=Lactococcus fujiensis TaxID=610251 RepID=UPI0020925E69|nr:DNA polymerase III subunit delta [Lactococcus fujiensis]
MASLLDAKKMKRTELFNYFNKVNPELSNPVLNRIVDKSNEQFPTIKQNIELIKTFNGNKKISIEDVEKVVPNSLQDNIFLLTEFVIRGKITEARNLVHDLTMQGEDIIKLTAILTNSFRLYYQTKLMQEKNWSEAKQTEQLKINPYRIKLANQLVGSISSTYFAQALLDLIDLDYQLKSTGADKVYRFDVTLIKLTLKKK